MNNLKVSPSYLKILAGRQRTAARDISDATGDDFDFVGDIERTHGLYVRAGVNGIADAAGARKKAGEAVKKVSEFLADQLDQATKIYTGTDQNAGTDLNAQLHDA